MFVGVISGNPLATVLARALVVGAVCYGVGSIIGYILASVIAREVVDHEKRFPFPGQSEPDPEGVGSVSA